MMSCIMKIWILLLILGITIGTVYSNVGRARREDYNVTAKLIFDVTGTGGVCPLLMKKGTKFECGLKPIQGYTHCLITCPKDPDDDPEDDPNQDEFACQETIAKWNLERHSLDCFKDPEKRMHMEEWAKDLRKILAYKKEILKIKDKGAKGKDLSKKALAKKIVALKDIPGGKVLVNALNKTLLKKAGKTDAIKLVANANVELKEKYAKIAVKAEVKKEVKAEVKAEVKKEVKAEVKKEVKAEVKKVMKTEVGKMVNETVERVVKAKLPKEVKKQLNEMKKDAPKEKKQNAKSIKKKKGLVKIDSGHDVWLGSKRCRLLGKTEGRKVFCEQDFDKKVFICHITCRGEKEKEHRCDDTGHWKPDLPKCVEKVNPSDYQRFDLLWAKAIKEEAKGIHNSIL